MDHATLVGFDVDAGRKVLDALDHAALTIHVALWVYSSDRDDWQLILSGPSLDQKHPLKAHRQVSEALVDKFEYRMPPLILILPLDDPFINILRRLFGKAKDVNGMRLGGQTIGDRYISDAYVYRIR